MNSSQYKDELVGNKVATFKVRVEEIIPTRVKAQAFEYFQHMKDVTLAPGKHTGDNRTEEEIAQDVEAIALLRELEDCTTPNHEAIAYGFMLYNESAIVKTYWHYRVGNRENKSQFHETDRQLEWLTEIFAMLNGDHPRYNKGNCGPLYYYKLDTIDDRGRHVGYYDVMRSFTIQWNRNFPSILSQDLYKQDLKDMEYGSISIDAYHDNENGAGEHLDAEMARNAKNTLNVEQQVTFQEIEDFLKEFLVAPLNQAIPSKAGTRSAGVTYLDVMKAIVNGTLTSVANLRKELGLSMAVQQRAVDHIASLMEMRGISMQDFADYLSVYGLVARDILNGVDNSFRKVQ